eukprot:SAG31_NODE_780_length_12148_cov_7.369295_1_plen_290_part_00
MRATMRLRDALVPYIYTAGLHAFRTGISLLRPMYYNWPAEDAAYTHPSQYMFGESILVSPVVSAGDNETGLAEKNVWLPTTADINSSEDTADDGWVNFVDGTPASAAGTKWGPSEIPAFVRPGSIVPMRTMNSTYRAFADPLIWTIWVPPTVPALKSSYQLYEDAGDGREYEDPRNTAHATTAVTLNVQAKTISFEVDASRGSFVGQGTSRQHLVQLRGINGDQVATVKVDKMTTSKTTARAAPDGASWYVATQSVGGKDNFTLPVGSVVVVVGRQIISKLTEVEVTLK